MKLTRPPDKTPEEPKVGSSNHWLFQPIERPEYTDSIKFPDDVTRLTPADVSKLHARYTALYAYAVAELAKVDVAFLRCRSTCSVQKNNVTRTGHTYGKNKHQIDVQVRLDKRLEDLELLAHEAEAKKIILTGYVEVFDKYIAALSREMSRRSAELKNQT